MEEKVRLWLVSRSLFCDTVAVLAIIFRTFEAQVPGNADHIDTSDTFKLTIAALMRGADFFAYIGGPWLFVIVPCRYVCVLFLPLYHVATSEGVYNIGK